MNTNEQKPNSFCTPGAGQLNGISLFLASSLCCFPIVLMRHAASKRLELFYWLNSTRKLDTQFGHFFSSLSLTMMATHKADKHFSNSNFPSKIRFKFEFKFKSHFEQNFDLTGEPFAFAFGGSLLASQWGAPTQLASAGHSSPFSHRHTLASVLSAEKLQVQS